MLTLLSGAAAADKGMVTFLIEHFKEGGWGMWPILLLLIFTAYLIYERTRYLYTCRIERAGFVAQMRKSLMLGDVAGAVRICSQSDRPLARMVEAGLRRLDQDDEHVQLAIDSVAMQMFPRIEKRTGYLAMLGNVATLMGLLGTITGLIRSFRAVGVGAGEEAAATAAKIAAAGQSKAELLAQGISEAMNCTAFGLIVGILALLAYSVLNGRTQTVIDEINETVVHVMNLATGHRQVMKMEGVQQIPEKDPYAATA